MTTELSTTYIKGMRLYARHGVMEQEGKTGAWFTVDVSVDTNGCPAAESDRIGDALDYGALCAVVKQEMAVPSLLVEHVAGRIARAVLQRFAQASAVTVSVTKDNPPMGANCQGAGVTLKVKS